MAPPAPPQGPSRPSPDPKTRSATLSEPGLAIRLLELQKRAYAIEARLVGFDDIPPLHESLEDVLASRLEWRVAELGRELVGAIGFRRLEGVVDIDRLVVDPDRLRRGIGRALVLEACGDSPATVSTGRDNRPAVRLYESLGFEALEDVEVGPASGSDGCDARSRAEGAPRPPARVSG